MPLRGRGDFRDASNEAPALAPWKFRACLTTLIILDDRRWRHVVSRPCRGIFTAKRAVIWFGRRWPNVAFALDVSVAMASSPRARNLQICRRTAERCAAWRVRTCAAQTVPAVGQAPEACHGPCNEKAAEAAACGLRVAQRVARRCWPKKLLGKAWNSPAFQQKPDRFRSVQYLLN